MAYFKEDSERPIVSAWVEQGFEIEQGYIIEAIETDCRDLSTDTMIAGVTAFGSIASGCLMLGLAGFSFPMVIPVIALVGSVLTAWNSDCSKGDRELERKFLKEYPAVFDRLSQKIGAGEGVNKIAAEYGQMFRSYVRHDRTALATLTAMSNPVSLTQPTIQNSETSNGSRTEPTTIAQTELQVTEIIPAIEPTHILNVEPIEVQTIPEPIAIIPEVVKPSYGVSKVLSPLDILIRARFSHRAFYGGQRTGKSYLAAIASQALSLTGIKVFHMNLFSHGPEDGTYWIHATRSVQCDLSSLSPDESVPFIRQAQSILSEFKVTKDALLIIDEITSMGNLRSEHLENLQPFINGLVSYINAIRDSSKKRHKAVWTIGPGIVSAGLDQGVKELIKGLSPVLVSIPKDVSILWEDQTLTTDMTVYGQLKVNYQGISDPPSMDCERMVLIDNIWVPMGNLPSLQTIDVKSEPIETSTKLTIVETIKPVEIEHWEADRAIEVSKVEPTKTHLLSDKFERLDTLMDGRDSLPIREIQRSLGCKSEEAQQIAQMYCFNKKSTYKFSQSTNSNGTLSKSIERL